jgi:predicted site-specific integrase-resolvase
LSIRTIHRYVADGKLIPTVITPGRQYRWSVEDVHRQMRELADRDRKRD